LNLKRNEIAFADGAAASSTRAATAVIMFFMDSPFATWAVNKSGRKHRLENN
jgi:hypothetical protein